jgi:hypothetical protein
VRVARVEIYAGARLVAVDVRAPFIARWRPRRGDGTVSAILRIRGVPPVHLGAPARMLTPDRHKIGSPVTHP